MTVSHAKPKLAPPVKVVAETPQATDSIVELTDVLRELTPHLAYLADSAGKISESAGGIASNIEGMKKFVNKFGPWLVAACGLVFPNIKSILDWIASVAAHLPAAGG